MTSSQYLQDFLDFDVLPRLFSEKNMKSDASWTPPVNRQSADTETVKGLRCFHCGTEDEDQLILSSPPLVTVSSGENTTRQHFDVDCSRCGGLTTLHCVDPSDWSGSSDGVECLNCGNSNQKLFKAVVNSKTETLINVQCMKCDLLETFGDNVEICDGNDQSLICDEQHDIELFEQENNAKNKELDSKLLPVAAAVDIPTTGLRKRCSSSVLDDRLSLSSESLSLEDKCSTSDAVKSTEKAIEHSLFRRRIHNLADLHRGDHIAFHRNYLVWHHAIVVKASPSTSEITMIHYNGAPKKLDGKLISVRLETEVVDAMDQELYRYEYDRSFEPQEVIERAASRLGEANYGPSRNCEHFARWCKTGEEKCFQVETVKHRLIATGVSTLGKQLEEGVVSVARYLCKEAPEEIFRVGTGGASYLAAIQDRALNLFSEGTDRMAYGMKWGALAGNFAVNFAIEAANFGIDVSNGYAWYREGKISFDDLRQQAAKTGCECIGGFLGSTGGGLLLQLLIPIPFIGGFVGCALGNIIGRLIGAGIGKQLHKR